MKTPNFFVDIHCHPSMKPYYSSLEHAERTSLWDYSPESPHCEELPKILRSQLKEMIKYSQMNLRECAKGNVNVLFSSLYPVERGWFKERFQIDPIISDKNFTNSITCSSGFSRDVVKHIIEVIENDEVIDYFAEIAGEYYYLLSEQAKSDNGDEEFVLVNSFDELERIVNVPEDKRIALVLNIEGGHSLIRFDDYYDNKKTPFRKVNKSHFSDFKKYKKIIFDNIEVLKGKREVELKVNGSTQKITFKHSPLYITFAHHFWNLLCGHSDTFEIGADLILNQDRGKLRKFTLLGKQVLHKLLERGQGERRILIDIKHFSLKARKEFYQIWQDDYADKNDSFPLIASHAAVNGQTYDEIIESFFNTAEVNMFDEDIKMIHKSGGLIGLILNESRLPGFESKKIIRQNKRKIRKLIKNDTDDPQIQVLKAENKDEYILALAANIWHIVRVINEKSAWDIISIGSDFDGMIDALNPYFVASDIKTLMEDLMDFMENNEGIEEIGLNKTEFERLKFGYSTEQIAEKIANLNAMLFLKKYFHDDFLIRGIVH